MAKFLFPRRVTGLEGRKLKASASSKVFSRLEMEWKSPLQMRQETEGKSYVWPGPFPLYSCSTKWLEVEG